MTPHTWPRVAVVGAGAVGCYFGARLAKAGAQVTLIGREAPMNAIAQQGLSIVSKDATESIQISTSTELSAVTGSDLVLFCVKTNDTQITARALQPYLKPQTALLSLQNGVDNVERIFQATGLRAIPAAVYVAVEVSAPGQLLHKGRGDLCIGAYPFGDREGAAAALAMAPLIEQVSSWFEAAGVPCPVSENVLAELWTKLIMNCAVNAISALAQVPYGRMVESPEERDMIAALVRETIEVGRAHAVRLKDIDYERAAFELIEVMPGQYSSTAQDIARGKPTEIDALNGFVAVLAQKYQIQTPLNRWLTTLVKLREKGKFS